MNRFAYHEAKRLQKEAFTRVVFMAGAAILGIITLIIRPNMHFLSFYVIVIGTVFCIAAITLRLYEMRERARGLRAIEELDKLDAQPTVER